MNNQSSLILVQVCLSTSVSADILILPSSILKDDYHFRNAVSEKKKRVPVFNYNHKSMDNITKAYVGHEYREKHNTKLRNSSVNHLSIKNMLPRF